MAKQVVHRSYGLIGREELILQIREVISNGSRPRIIVVTGPGGIGKTALIREVAVSFEHDFENIILNPFQIKDPEKYYSLVKSEVSLGRATTLVVFDNITRFDIEAERLLRRIAGIKKVQAVVAITRDIEDEPVFKLHKFTIPSLSLDASIMFLKLHGRTFARYEISDADLMMLAQDAQGHPLTLSMIAFYLKITRYNK